MAAIRNYSRKIDIGSFHNIFLTAAIKGLFWDLEWPFWRQNAPSKVKKGKTGLYNTDKRTADLKKQK
jgi:hypothetical protein